jgi:lipoyl-dependent peroxiredoxin
MTEIRHASVTWNGDLATGAGMITHVSSGVFLRLPISWAARTGPHGGKTSPEELLAAAHASCFSMALASRLAKNRTPASSLDVRVEVAFDQGDAGWGVKSSSITVVGTVPGIDEATFLGLVDDARDNCPISRALKGNVEISVQGSLTVPPAPGTVAAAS